MKLVTYEAQGAQRPGIFDPRGDGTILDLLRALAFVGSRRGGPSDERGVRAELCESVLGFVERANVVRPLAEEAHALHLEGELPRDVSIPAKGTRLLAPIPRPPSMRDGYAFRQHVATARKNRGLEMIPEFDQFPVFYFTNHQAVTGPGKVAVREKHTERLDFELEAAIVVGKECRDLSAMSADDAIFGMTIMNDWSARGLQMKEMLLSLGPAKGKDFATSLGPWLVTMDELLPATKPSERGAQFDLGMRAFVNGEQLSTGNLADMTWTFAQILERASYGVTLYPGDVIGSGTCGTGCLLELNGSKVTHDQWLKPGDTVALEIDRLGRLENTIELA